MAALLCCRYVGFQPRLGLCHVLVSVDSSAHCPSLRGPLRCRPWTPLGAPGPPDLLGYPETPCAKVPGVAITHLAGRAWTDPLHGAAPEEGTPRCIGHRVSLPGPSRAVWFGYSHCKYPGTSYTVPFGTYCLG